MKSKTLVTIVITCLLTSLVWLLIMHSKGLNLFQPTETIHDTVYLAAGANNEENDDVVRQAEVNEVSTSTSDIYGCWKSVQSSKYDLDISQYGTFKAYMKGMDQIPMQEFTYKADNEHITLISEFHKSKLKYRVVKENGSTYLEIFDNADYGGRYKKK